MKMASCNQSPVMTSLVCLAHPSTCTAQHVALQLALLTAGDVLAAAFQLNMGCLLADYKANLRG